PGQTAQARSVGRESRKRGANGEDCAMPRSRRSLVAVVALSVLAAGSAGAVEASTGSHGPTNADRLVKAQPPVDDPALQPFDFARKPSAQDRYSLAGGCF